MNEKIPRKTGLPPIIDKESRVLILGTLPGDESLRLSQYYADSSNQFWRILHEVYRQNLGSKYLARLEFLHAKKLALWDVLKSAERSGSSDRNLKNIVANDFVSLFAKFPDVSAIVFNGGTAQTMFERYVEKFLANSVRSRLDKTKLPSTSATRGQYVLPLDEKVVRWNCLRTLWRVEGNWKNG